MNLPLEIFICFADYRASASIGEILFSTGVLFTTILFSSKVIVWFLPKNKTAKFYSNIDLKDNIDVLPISNWETNKTESISLFSRFLIVTLIILLIFIPMKDIFLLDL